MRRDLLIFAAVAVTALACAGVAIMIGWGARGPTEKDRYDRTNLVIRCIEIGEHRYFETVGTDPATLDECLVAVASDRYCAERGCAVSPVRDDILARRDGWGRPLAFERRTLSNGVIEVTVISAGPNGKRDFTGKSYLVDAPKGDDEIGHFYLRPTGSAAPPGRGQHRPGKRDEDTRRNE